MSIWNEAKWSFLHKDKSVSKHTSEIEVKTEDRSEKETRRRS
jgi:hypothetical protein